MVGVEPLYTSEDLDDDRNYSWRFYLNLQSNMNVLSILDDKCATVSFYIAENVKSITSLHNDVKNLKTLNNKKKVLGYKNINFVNSGHKDLPVRENSFDICIVEKPVNMFQVSHNHERKQLINKVYPILKNGGQILFIIKNPFLLSSVLSRDKNKVRKWNRVLSYKNFYNINKAMLEECGFHNIKIINYSRGAMGEAYSVYGNNYHTMVYYYRNFIGLERFIKLKRIIYYMLSRIKIYKLLADTYIFVANKNDL